MPCPGVSHYKMCSLWQTVRPSIDSSDFVELTPSLCSQHSSLSSYTALQDRHSSPLVAMLALVFSVVSSHDTASCSLERVRVSQIMYVAQFPENRMRYYDICHTLGMPDVLLQTNRILGHILHMPFYGLGNACCKIQIYSI